MTRAFDKWTTEIIPVVGGTAALANHSVMLTPGEGMDAVFLGRFDIAELLRRACDCDGEALETLGRVMAEGHRFTGDIGEDGEEEPF